MSDTDPHSLKFSPKALMKAWRPERFSDSTVNPWHPLNASILEYHLSVLTAHNKETEFERFAKVVAEHAICPNLLPQIGPTGGGDAKVDTENYPVAQQLTLAWYFGAPGASEERWGFAFSAMKDWKPKVKSDIRKIAATGRGYTKAFFISNQLISDKEAAAVQDGLTADLGLEVRVFGLLWLIQEVFSKRLEAVTIKTLGLDLPVENIRIEGPNDAARKNILEQLEASIAASIKDGNQGPDLVNDCIAAARLSRELEHSRDEIDGKYHRAKRLAAHCGTSAQRILAAYQHSWTTFHWHEDFDQFSAMYDEFEGLTKDTENAAHLELLNNLWHLAFTLSRLKQGAHGADKFGARTITLAQALERVSQIAERPSSALQARSMLLIQNITSTIPSVPPSVFIELQDVVNKSGQLIGFPFDSLVDVIGLLDRMLGGSPEFEALHEALVDATAVRSGQADAAHLNLRRAAARIEAGKYYDAITLIGRSLVGLSQHEHRKTLVLAINLISHSYEKVGLLWAARGALLNSICIIIGEFETTADTSRLRSGPIFHMKWLELQLGRLAPSLEWARFASVSEQAFGDDLEEDKRMREWMSFDTGIGLLCLQADLEQLDRLTSMPDVFSKCGFEIARASLLFALGQEDDFYKHIAREGDGPDEVFTLMTRQPIAENIPAALVCDQQGRWVFLSQIWGCRISVSTPDESPFIELAESILASAEAIFSTLGKYRVVAVAPKFTITINPHDCEWFEFECDTSSSMLIRCGKFDSKRQKQTDGDEIQTRLTELIINLFCRAFTGSDILKISEKLFRDELAMDRGRAWIGSFVTLSNVLGDKPNIRLSDWLDGTETRYPRMRTKVWRPNNNHAKQSPESAPEMSQDEESGSQFQDAHQRDIAIDNLISISDWDAAKWSGAAFLHDPSHTGIPILALMFEGADAARRIFAHWRSELGNRDTEDRLRIAIIKGINKAKQNSYRIAVSANPKRTSVSFKTKFFTLTSRMKTMEPASPQNLSIFLSLFQRFGVYGLTWARWDGNSAKPIFDNVILKRDLIIRDAWQIGLQDMDCVTIQADDDPIIPVGEANPPILDLLAKIRKE